VEGCVDSGPVPGGFPLTGTFSLATADGATYTGEAVGSVFPLELTLELQSATNTRPRQLGGTILFTGSDVTGELVGALKPGLGNQG
jgi:hypothetical protein